MTDFSAARPVVVAGLTPTRADITLVPARLAMVSGVVLDHDRKPVSGGRLPLSPGDGFFGLDSRAVVIRPDGTFVARALPPGTYHFQFREGPWPPPQGVIPHISAARVVLAGEDVRDVRVAPLEMVRATGRLVVDPAARAALVPSQIRVGASPIDFDGNPGPQQSGLVNEDLTFEFRTWPSVGRVRVTPIPPGWSVKAVRLKGIDVTEKGIDFVAGQEISGLEVEIVKR